jgi:hypothetical protein
VRDFIRFRPGDAASLPIEPIPNKPAPEPSKTGEKLFETEPECKNSPNNAQDASNTTQPTQSTAVSAAESSETSVEERLRTKERKKRKLRGMDAIIPPRASEVSDHEHTD